MGRISVNFRVPCVLEVVNFDTNGKRVNHSALLGKWLKISKGLKIKSDHQGKINGTYYNIRELVESVVSKRLLHVLSRQRLAFFTSLGVIVMSCIDIDS